MLYEIRKILSIRGLIIWGAFILTGTLLIPLFFTFKFNEFNRKYYGDVNSVYRKVWDTYQGKNSIESWIDNSLKESERVNTGFHFENPIAAYTLYLCKKSARKTGKSMPIYFDFNMEKHSLSWLNEQLDKIENKDSYLFRNMLKEKNMMEDCKLEYVNVAYWNVFDEWENLAVIMVFIFVLFALAGIYTNECSTNMNYVLCTARRGYLRIIADKWLAGCILGIGSILLVNINLAAAIILCGSSSGYGVNIANLGVGLVYTPYNMTIGEYMTVKIIFQSLGMIFLVSFTEYFSLQNPYSYPAILFGGILFLPQIVSYFAMGREAGGLWSILDFLYDLSLLGAIRPEHAFYKYRSVNILGNPVNYTTVYIIVLICLTVLMCILTVKDYHKYIVRLNR